MPQIIVTADRTGEGDEAPVLLRERVNVADFESDHFAAQLVQRLGWAVSDAVEVAGHSDVVEAEGHSDAMEAEGHSDVVEAEGHSDAMEAEGHSDAVQAEGHAVVDARQSARQS
ncbi:MAG: hypothetical protein JOZ98_15160 [Solirubrobacterales bacterium]|nr:hypothetical protein [Solirubrobacterales bacterium]